MTFLGAGGAEEGENAVSQCSHDSTFEPCDGLAHGVEGGLEALHCVFSGQTSDQFGRADEIGEQNRHLLQLSANRIVGACCRR